MNHWKKIESILKFKNQYIKVWEDKVELPSKKHITYTRVDLPDFVSIIPVFKDEIVLVRNYRYAIDQFCLELPSGHLMAREKPEDAARRELKEETGFFGKKFIFLMKYFAAADRTNLTSYIFLAKDLELGSPLRDETEEMSIVYLKKEEILSKILKNEIVHPPTIIGLMLYLFLEEKQC